MIFLAASMVFVLDRITKIAIVSSMHPGESISVLPNIFHITFVLNNGTAFGLLKGQNVILAAFSGIVAVAITVYAVTHKIKNLALSLVLGLILGGALGNLFDRVKFGCVVDFIDLRVWPVFNIADSAITVGVVILGILLCTRSSLR